jgi:hypothetical protein
MQELLQEKLRLKRALMDPGVIETSNDDNGLGGLGKKKIS